MRKLIEGIAETYFSNPALMQMNDFALVDAGGNIAVSTDSFVIKPYRFPGGDIGKLSICGTCNDLAMMGARPIYLSCGFIIEEGFAIDDLKKIVNSMKTELGLNSAKIITGDTKVVPRGNADGIFINTTGVGEIIYEGISSSNISSGDVILVSHSIGEHGAHIFVNREGINIKSDLKSDCASLWPIVEKLTESGIKIKALRDATRGGVSAVLNEWAEMSSVCINVTENDVPVLQEVRGICELLGFEPFHLACEGTFLIAVEKDDAEKALKIIKSNELGRSASIIGYVNDEFPERVVVITEIGTKRLLDSPSGVLLPRIC